MENMFIKLVEFTLLINRSGQNRRLGLPQRIPGSDKSIVRGGFLVEKRK